MPDGGREELVPLVDVQRLVLGLCRPLTPTELVLSDSLGCVIASDVRASSDLPPFDNSAMDGYAVRSGDTDQAPVELEVTGVVAAGSTPSAAVEAGCAVQIMTGAPMPEGADGIAIVERTEPGSRPGTVRVLERVSRGDFIRPAGSDLRAGEVAIPAGAVIGPAHVSLLASVGLTTVSVYPRPRVGVLSTGDELAEAGPPLPPGKIHDSNRHGLLAALRRDGFDGVDLGIVPDDKDLILQSIHDALTRCDALLTSGGVSMGEFDFVKVALDQVIAESGGEIHQLKVAIKPAKPLSFAAVTIGGRSLPAFGLPGNPVSSMVSYQVIALPALRKLAGHQSPLPHLLAAVAADEFERRPDGKLHLIRVVAAMGPDGRVVVRSAGAQGSHQLSALVASNALALVPDGDGVRTGEGVRVLLTGTLE